jgi:hypothetical protein
MGHLPLWIIIQGMEFDKTIFKEKDSTRGQVLQGRCGRERIRKQVRKNEDEEGR